MSDIHSIIELAMDREEDAYVFYTRVAGRTKDAAIRQLFTELASDELGHKQFLQGCLADPELLQKLPAPPDYKVAESVQAVELGVDLKPVDAVALAMKREQESADHYRQLAAGATVADYRRAFEGLARMELNHKYKLEQAFVDIGYPEAF